MTTPYDSWDWERLKAQTIEALKNKIDENELSFEELTMKSDELEAKCLKLEKELDDARTEYVHNEYLRILVLYENGDLK